MNDMEMQVLQEEDQNSLEHYGVKGQKWGQRNYQNPDGTYTDLGKERRRVAFIKEEKAKKDANAHQNGIEESIDTDVKIGGKAYKDMTRKELRAAKKRARHNEAERRARREFNREKKQALEDGDLAFISKNISKFTNEEIDSAMVRFKKMQDLRNLDKANRKDADHYIDKALHYLDKASTASKSISNIANNFNDMSKKLAEKKKAWIDYEYTKDPSLKPLTDNEKLKNESVRLQNDKTKEAILQAKETTKQAIIDTENKRQAKKEEMAKIAEEARKTKLDNDMLEQEIRDKKYTADQKAIERDQKKFELDMQKKAVKDAEQAEENAKKQLKEAIRAGQIFEEKQLREALKQKEQERKEAEAAERKARYEAKKATDEANRELKEHFRRIKELEEGKKRQKQAEKEWEKAIKEEAREVSNKHTYESMSEIYNEDNWGPFGSSSKTKQSQSKLGGWFSKKDKDKVHKDNDQDFDLDDKSINIVTRKYLNQLKDSPKDYFNENKVQNDQWKKDIKKQDTAIIDKWVKDMKKKYMKERNLDSKTAEEKAEEYVDSWLDAYDDGKL